MRTMRENNGVVAEGGKKLSTP